MPIAVKCPSCATRLNAPSSSAGKRVKCPKCGTGIAVPEAESDFEMVDDEPTPARPAKPVAARKPVDDDEDDDRPRKRRRDDDDDDEDDDRPRKKGKRKSEGKKKGGLPVVLIAAIGGGVAVLAIVGTVLFFVFGGKPTGPGGILGPSTPAGFSVVGESAIGVKMFLPGEVKGQFVRKGSPDGPPDPNFYSASGMSGDPMGFMQAMRTPGFKPIATAEELATRYDQAPFVNRPTKFEVLGKKPVTLGGKPGLEYRMKELPDLWDDTPQKAEFFKDKNDQERQRVEREGKYYAVLVTVNGEWTYVISIERKRQPVDDQTVKTVADSITFN